MCTCARERTRTHTKTHTHTHMLRPGVCPCRTAPSPHFLYSGLSRWNPSRLPQDFPRATPEEMALPWSLGMLTSAAWKCLSVAAHRMGGLQLVSLVCRLRKRERPQIGDFSGGARFLPGLVAVVSLGRNVRFPQQRQA